jgi:hypothetical protein
MAHVAPPAVVVPENGLQLFKVLLNRRSGEASYALASWNGTGDHSAGS